MKVATNNPHASGSSALLYIQLTAEELKKATGQTKPFENHRATLRREENGKWSLKIDKNGANKVIPYETEGKRGNVEKYVCRVSFSIGDFGYKWVTPHSEVITPEFSAQSIHFTFHPNVGLIGREKAKNQDPVEILKKAKADFSAAVSLLLEAGYEISLIHQNGIVVLTGSETLTAKKVVTREETF